MNSISYKDNLFIWWNQHKEQFPILSVLAQKYLIIPSTSVPSERLFSDIGNIISQKRAGLDPETAISLCYLYENSSIVKY